MDLVAADPVIGGGQQDRRNSLPGPPTPGKFPGDESVPAAPDAAGTLSFPVRSRPSSRNFRAHDCGRSGSYGYCRASWIPAPVCPGSEWSAVANWPG